MFSHSLRNRPSHPPTTQHAIARRGALLLCSSLPTLPRAVRFFFALSDISMKYRFAPALLALALYPVFASAQNEIGFIEKFALAPDREAVLQQLVPGTEEYYFFHALHYQNTRNVAKLKATMEQWAKKFPESAQRTIIENREALLSYDTDPKATLKFLRDRLNLEFNHERETSDEPPNLPTALDQKLVNREAFVADALQDSDDLEHFGPHALELLVRDKTQLTPAQRSSLLSKIERPDIPGLVNLIATDLASEDSGGFGERDIHKALLPEQLDELATRKPALKDDEDFIKTRLGKIVPGADEDIDYDPAARTAWLDRLWAYARRLSPSFNTTKAQILYQRLLLDRTLGVYDKARFLEYIALPRQTDYMRPEYLERHGGDASPVDFNEAPFESLPGLKSIVSDDWLIREYLLHFFETEASWQPWATYFKDSFLKPLFAEAKITAGTGASEKWASLLSPEAFQELKDRVDLEFSPANPTTYKPGSDVSLDLFVKNAPKLTIKIYEINTLSFFLTQNRDLNTDLQLDGLIANVERTQEFAEPPLRRIARKFEFPELKGRRGAWIIEFVGGGKSSRALIRKGQWSLVQQMGPAGDMITVLDEERHAVPDAVVWLDGRKYSVNPKTQCIHIPFTQKPGDEAIILADSAGTFATRASFHHHGEQYALDAQFHIAREQLVAGREATLGIRTVLRLGDEGMPLNLLRDTKLAITSTTLDGISTTSEVKDLTLDPAKLLTHTFVVPKRLASIAVKLSANVESLSSGGEKKELTATHEWKLNGIDKTAATNDGYFSRMGNQILFELFGKDGEPIPNQQVVFKFTHRDFTNEIEVPLRSDDHGRIDLGELAGISHIRAELPNERATDYQLGERAIFPRTLHAAVGEPMEVPWLGESKLTPFDASLLEIRGKDNAVANRFDALKLANGILTINGLPAGDYQLVLRGQPGDSDNEDKDEDNNKILIRVAAGQPVAGWLAGPNRNLETRNFPPVHIKSVTVQPDAVVVQLRNLNPFTRVHVTATRFAPESTLLEQLGSFTISKPGGQLPAREPNLFVSGRMIGDEYRYILERRHLPKFPGNMLARPGLLLDPWEVRSTDIATQTLHGAEQLQTVASGRKAQDIEEQVERRKESEADNPISGEEERAGSSFDFLASAASVLYNLVPDAQGVVRIDRKWLGDRQEVHVYAEDLSSAEEREVGLPEQQTKFRDLALSRALDAQKHFTESKEVSVLQPGQALVVEDVIGSELQTYDSIASVYTLFTTLNHEGAVGKFAWIVKWPQLSEEEKRAKYSEFACHELNLFLFRKDPAFFSKVIQPYLRNKKDKTFLDEYLLGDDLQSYLEPWQYGRLNIAERTLLSRRIPDQADSTARHIRELWEMVPPHLEDDNRLFETALHGESMQRGDLAAAAELADATVPASPKAPAGSVAIAGTAATSEYRAIDPAKSTNGFAISPNAIDALMSPDQAEKFKNEAELRRKADEDSAKPRENSPVDAYNSTRAHQLWQLDKGWAQPVNRHYMYYGRTDLGLEVRAEVRQFYREIGPTKEWAENNYYQLPINNQNAELIPVSAFWRDYAAWDGKSPFLSTHFPEAARNFSEMMFALAVLDLPFESPKAATHLDNGKYTLTANGSLFAFRKEIHPAVDPGADQAASELLISENFFRENDRYQEDQNEKAEKFVTGEFLSGVTYGAEVVATNPTSSPLTVEVLTQIPQGALPVLGSKATDSKQVRLEPYAGQKLEYYFYFPHPAPQPLPHYPAQVTRHGKFAGAAKGSEFKVVKRLAVANEDSWDYVSQDAKDDAVFAYLEKHNIEQLDLDRIAWRARKSAAFFHKLIELLAARHTYNHTIYSYAIPHRDTAALREWLQHQDDFIAQCGPYLGSKLLTIDPIERYTYQHLEYSPLINQRAHRVGAENAITNPVVRGQYQSLLQIFAHKPRLDAGDELSLVYYLFLQDRVEEALARLNGIKPESLPTRLQYDYFRCYAAFYQEKPADARAIAAAYAEYPVDRWAKIFRDVVAQADEIDGREAAAAQGQAGAKPDREAQQSTLAGSEPSFDLKVENRTISLTWKNLREVTINYYRMDPEFLFSSSPFVSEDSTRFAIVKATRTAQQALPEGKDTLDIPVPDEFANANVLIEVLGAGQRKAQTCHANSLKLRLAQNYGRLELRDALTDKMISRAYVKVYARLKGGAVRFYKDGYTDLRGKFDYASLNAPESAGESSGEPAAGTTSLNSQMLRPSELGVVEKLAILILSESNGALVREVDPPAE